MVGRCIGSDLVLILLNGAGKSMDTDNGMEGDFPGKQGSHLGRLRGVGGDLIPVTSELAEMSEVI